MMLPVEPHSQFLIDVSRLRISTEVINHLKVELTLAPFKGKQISSVFPRDKTREIIGIYELLSGVLSKDCHVYYMITGYPPIELIHMRKNGSVLDHQDGAKWLERATRNCGAIHRAIIEERDGV